jgi:acetyl esterase
VVVAPAPAGDRIKYLARFRGMPLHPQARALLEQGAEAGLPRMNELDAPAARRQAALMNEAIGDGPELPLVEELSIPTSAGSVAGRRYVPPRDPAATVLWIHGGGWVICDLDSHDAMCRLLAVESGCEVIALDYRRAPEHPFPAPLEDCWDALRWVAREAGERPVALGGDSAGGNLAAVCALRARDHGGPSLLMQVLVYPVTNCDLATRSYVEHGSDPDGFLTTDEMRWFWNQYVADPDARSNPEVSPLRATDHSGLPPAVVVTAEHDPLRDDGLAYVEALRSAGVPVTHHHFDDMIHAFFALVNVLDRGNEAVALVGGEIRGAVARARAVA